MLFAEQLKRFFSKRPSKILHDIPYYSQFESPELVFDIIEEKIKTEDDPLWQNSGAKDKEEYTFWSWRVCGFTCLKMILEYRGKGEYPLVDLAKMGVKYGAYDLERDYLGMIYKPFCDMIGKEFGIKGKATALSIRRIKNELAKGNDVIVSVHPRIRDRGNPEPRRKGGHLILVVGYDDEQKSLFVNNPSGTYGVSQKAYELTEKDFKKFFAGRGIILSA